MNDKSIHVLLVEDDPGVAKRIEASLIHADRGSFRVEWVVGLGDALERLGRPGVEVVLLDLTLSDGAGIEVFDRVLEAAPDALILILSTTDDEALTLEAIQRGAHDYLVKGRADPHWVPRALRYACERKAVLDALRTSEARFRAMSDASPLGIFVADAEGRCVYTNTAYQTISGLTSEQSLDTNWVKAIHPEDRRRVVDDWLQAARGREPFHTEFRFQREDGSLVWTSVNSAAMLDGNRVQGHLQTVEDVTERKAMELGLRVAEEALFAEKERAQVTLNSIGDGVLATDLRGNVTYQNSVSAEMTGWPGIEALGRPLAEVFKIIDGTTRKTGVNPALRAIEENRNVGLAADCVLIRRDGSELAIEDSAAPIHNRVGGVCGAVIVFHDVSQSRAIAIKMAHLAQHDSLTGLPNRVLLMERLSLAIRLAHRRRKQAALLFMDLDDFKGINDSLGHAIGDQLLQSVAARLTAAVRESDTVCRQGGDEFVIVLTEIEQRQDAALVAQKLLQTVAAPGLIEGHERQVTLSIGIGVYPDDGLDVDTLLRNADTAMYQAKASGRNNYQFFDAAWVRPTRG